MHVFLTLILGALSMVGALAVDACLPSFPAIAETFQASPLAVQQVLSLFLFPFALMMLFYGTLSDAAGRRPVVLWPLALYTVASLGCAVAPTLGVLLACRVAQGLAAGAGPVICRAIVQDRFSGAVAQRLLSHTMMVFGLAPAVAPIIGGWLQVTLGWRSVFYFLAAFGALMWLVAWRWLPESLPAARRQPLHLGVIAANYWKVLRHRQFLLIAVSIGLAFSGFGLYIGSAAYFVMNILHLPETGFGWLFLPLISASVLGSWLAGKLAHRPPPRTLIRWSLGLMLAAALLNVAYNHLFVASVPWALAPLFLYSLGQAVSMAPMLLIAMEYFPDNSGLASSLQGFVQMALFSLVSGLAAPLLFDSAFKLALGVLAGLVLALICWFLADSGHNHAPAGAESR